jgi:hypothetical protein
VCEKLQAQQRLEVFNFNFGFAIEKHNQTLFNQQMLKVQILPKPTTLTKETTMKKTYLPITTKAKCIKKKMIVTIF